MSEKSDLIKRCRTLAAECMDLARTQDRLARAHGERDGDPLTGAAFRELAQDERIKARALRLLAAVLTVSP